VGWAARKSCERLQREAVLPLENSLQPPLTVFASVGHSAVQG
jgi:hypothetical protein